MKFDVIKNKLKSNKNINTKIIHISDIHFSIKYNSNLLEKIEDFIKNENPNFICITGDLIDNMDVAYKKCINDFYVFIEKLAKISKVIISLGNHEFYTKTNNKINKYVHCLKKISNVFVLDNNNYVFDNINFIGYTENNDYYGLKNNRKVIKEVSRLLCNINNTYYNILLAHNPNDIIDKNNFFDIKNINKLDLMLSGHTHGGLISASKKGHCGLVSANKKLFPKNVRGYIRKGNTDVIISTGVVKLSRNTIFHLLNFLFLPAIDIIEIKK